MSRKGKSKFSTGSKYNTKIGQLFLGRSQNKLNKEDIVTGMRIKRTLENEYDKASKALDNLESIRPENDNKIMDKDLLESMVKTSDIDVSIKYDALAIKENNEGDRNMEDLYKKYNIQCDDYPYGKEVTDFMLKYFDENDPARIELINATIEQFNLDKRVQSIGRYIKEVLKLPFTHQAKRGRKPGTKIIKNSTKKPEAEVNIDKILIDRMINESGLCEDVEFTDSKTKIGRKYLYSSKLINRQMGMFLIENFREFEYQPQENLYCKYVQYMLKRKEEAISKHKDPNVSEMKIFDEQTFKEYIINTHFYNIEPMEDHYNMYIRLEKPTDYNLNDSKDDDNASISKTVKEYLYKFNDIRYNVDDMLVDIKTNLNPKDTVTLFKADKSKQRQKLKYELFKRGIIFNCDYDTRKDNAVKNQIIISEVPQRLEEKIHAHKQSSFVAPVFTSANNFVTTQLKDVSKISFDDLLEKYQMFCQSINDDMFIHDLHTEMIRLGHYNPICENDIVYYVKEVGVQKEKLKQEMYNNILSFIKTCDTHVLTAQEILGICEDQFPIYKIDLDYIIKILDENFIGYTQLLHTVPAPKPVIEENSTTQLDEKSVDFKTGTYITPYNNIPIHMTAEKLKEEQKQKDLVIPIKETTMKELERIYKMFNAQLDEYPNTEEFLFVLNIIKKYKQIGLITNQTILRQINIDNKIQEELRHDREATFTTIEQSIAEGYVLNTRRAKMNISNDLVIFLWFIQNISDNLVNTAEQLLLNVKTNREDIKYVRTTDFIYSGQSECSILDPDENKSKVHERFINNVDPYSNFSGTLKLAGTDLIVKTSRQDNRYNIKYNKNGDIIDSRNSNIIRHTLIKPAQLTQSENKVQSATIESTSPTDEHVITPKSYIKSGTSLYEIVYRKSGGGFGSFTRSTSYYRANSEHEALEMFEKYKNTLKDVYITDVKCYRVGD